MRFFATIGPRNRSYIRNISCLWLSPSPDPSDVMLALRDCDSLQHLQLRMFHTTFSNVLDRLSNVNEISWVPELLKIRGLKTVEVVLAGTQLYDDSSKRATKLKAQLDDMLHVLKEPRDRLKEKEVELGRRLTGGTEKLAGEAALKKARTSHIPFSFQSDTYLKLAHALSLYEREQRRQKE